MKHTILSISVWLLLSSCGAAETETTTNVLPSTPQKVEQLVSENKEQKTNSIVVDTTISTEDKKTEETVVGNTEKVDVKPIEKKTVKKENTTPPAPVVVEKPKTEIIPEFNHEVFDGLLQKYVSASGKVNYKGFVKEKAKLEQYIAQLQKEFPNLSSWSKSRRLAYWINVYNAYTIKLIVNHYPTSSITKLKGGKPWDYKFIKLGTQNYSLNNVENDIIRPRFNDPRIHVGVNCASFSCPKLGNRAFTEHNLNSKLNALVKVWLKDNTKNQITANSLKISKIFDWYKVDFTKNGKTVIDFINKYHDVKVASDTPIEYLGYKWDLNE